MSLSPPAPGSKITAASRNFASSNAVGSSGTVVYDASCSTVSNTDYSIIDADGPSCDPSPPSSDVFLIPNTRKRWSSEGSSILNKVPRCSSSLPDPYQPVTVGTNNVFLRCMNDIVELVDLNTLVPFLTKHGLLTSEEREYLLSEQLKYKRKRELVDYMTAKGKRAPALFLQALKEEPEHLGHQELYITLSKAMSKRTSLAQTLKPVYSQDDFCIRRSSCPWVTHSESFPLALIKKALAVTPEQVTLADICQYLDRYPHIRALAHIPLSLFIWFVEKKVPVLPETTTELFQCYIRQVCSHNKAKYKKSNNYARATYSLLCKIALEGIKISKFMFTAEELKSEGIKLHEAFDGLGLLKAILSFRNPACLTEEYMVLYQFLHTGVQEFLAAQRIQELGAEEQIRLLSTYRNERRFYNTWKFLAGITKLQDRHFRDFAIFSTNEKNSKELLFLLHCIYEAHNPVICQEIAYRLHYKLNFSNTSLNPTDCLCAMYTVISAGGYWELIFRGSHIGAEGLEILKEHLKQAYMRSSTDHYSLCITKLDLSQSDLNGKAVASLAEILQGPIVIEFLGANANHCLGDEEAEVLTAALKKNQHLKELQLGSCNLTAKGVAHVADMLKGNCHLEHLHLTHQKIGDDGVCSLALALPINTTLAELRLSGIGMTGTGLRELAHGLKGNQSLQELWIDHNNFGLEDCVHLAAIIRETKSLRKLEISKNNIGDDGFVTVIDAVESSLSLKELWALGCGIQSKGMKRFSCFLKTTTVFEVIQISGNSIRDEGAMYLIEGIKNNQSLKEVWIEKIAIRSSKIMLTLMSLHNSRDGLMVTQENYKQVLNKRRKSKLR